MQSYLSETESIKILVSNVNSALTLRCRREQMLIWGKRLHPLRGWRPEAGVPPASPSGTLGAAGGHPPMRPLSPGAGRSCPQGALHGSRGRSLHCVFAVTVTDCSADGSKLPGKGWAGRGRTCCRTAIGRGPSVLRAQSLCFGQVRTCSLWGVQSKHRLLLPQDGTSREVLTGRFTQCSLRNRSLQAGPTRAGQTV